MQCNFIALGILLKALDAIYRTFTHIILVPPRLTSSPPLHVQLHLTNVHPLLDMAVLQSRLVAISVILDGQLVVDKVSLLALGELDLVLLVVEAIVLRLERVEQSLDFTVRVQRGPGLLAGLARAGLQHEQHCVESVFEFLHRHVEDGLGRVVQVVHLGGVGL